MARIVGVDLPKNKRGEIGLTYIYGIGRSTAQKILDQADIDKDIKVQDWTDDQISKIRKILNDKEVKIQIIPSEYSDFRPDNWWKSRKYLRIVIIEYQKLIYYWFKLI